MERINIKQEVVSISDDDEINIKKEPTGHYTPLLKSGPNDIIVDHHSIKLTNCSQVVVFQQSMKLKIIIIYQILLTPLTLILYSHCEEGVKEVNDIWYTMVII